MTTTFYEYLAISIVQCPKCGSQEEVPLQSNNGHELEYAAVCQSTLDLGGSCGTTLQLRATAHLFPEPVTES